MCFLAPEGAISFIRHCGLKTASFKIINRRSPHVHRLLPFAQSFANENSRTGVKSLSAPSAGQSINLYCTFYRTEKDKLLYTLTNNLHGTNDDLLFIPSYAKPLDLFFLLFLQIPTINEACGSSAVCKLLTGEHRTVPGRHLSLSSQTNFFLGPITLLPGFSSSSSSEPFLSPSSDCCLQDKALQLAHIVKKKVLICLRCGSVKTLNPMNQT